MPAKSADKGCAADLKNGRELRQRDRLRSTQEVERRRRRLRVTSPKVRADDAGGGSLISPEPVRAGSPAEMHSWLLLSFVTL